MAFGVDWHGRKKLSAGVGIDRNKVTGLTPISDVPLYTDSQARPLVLAKALLNSRQWYNLGTESSDPSDQGPGQLAYAAKHDAAGTSTKFLGEFWIRYSVTLQGSTTV